LVSFYYKATKERFFFATKARRHGVFFGWFLLQRNKGTIFFASNLGFFDPEGSYVYKELIGFKFMTLSGSRIAAT
jgi:hypothetical protein